MGADRNSLTPRERPDVTRGPTIRMTTGCGDLYVTVNHDEQGPCEVFAHLEGAGSCAAAQLEAICRLISILLRASVSYEAIIKQLKGIRCPSVAWEEGKAVLSCADAIATVMEQHIKS